MMRSLFSGVSGLRVHQTKMDVIGNNISNVNTVGFKASRVTFSEVFSQTLSGASRPNDQIGTGGVNPTQIGLGVGLASIDLLMTEGASQRTDNPLDMKINGDSFFIVGDTNGQYFTRAGAFRLDVEGNLVGPSGLRVYGYQSVPKQTTERVLNEDTDEYETRLVDVPGEYMIQKGKVTPLVINSAENMQVAPSTTKAVEFGGNLYTGDSPITKTLSFYDSLGNRYEITSILTYTGQDNEWRMKLGTEMYMNGDMENAIPIGDSSGDPDSTTGGLKVYDPNGEGDTDGDSDIDLFGEGLLVGFSDTGKMQYLVSNPLDDGSGTPVEPDPDNPVSFIRKLNLVIDPSVMGGVPVSAKFGDPKTNPPNGMVIDFSGLTQYNTKTTATMIQKGGNTAGVLSGFNIGSDGIITGRYSNGDTKILGQIAVARFKNAAGLEKMGDNLYTTTPNSGEFDGVGEEPKASGGSLTAGVLEMSNVDLAGEFTEMITTQRGFQANSKVITTSDDMLQELVNLKR